jgi:hypothetical protein
MKSSFRSPRSAYLKSIFWIAQLALCFGGPTVAEAGQRDSSTGSIQAELNAQAELPQGYLLGYSATERFDDGGTFYYPHSSYSIYLADGKLFKNVKITFTERRIPALGVAAGSIRFCFDQNRGYIRLPLSLQGDGRSRSDGLDGLQKRFAQPRPARAWRLRHPRVCPSDYSISRKLG